MNFMELMQLIMLFMMKVIGSMSNNPMTMGGCLLLMSFILLVFILKGFNFWYGLIFFLMYMGAVLVLVFYLICVSSKPMNFKFKLTYFVVFCFVSLVFLFYKSETLTFFFNEKQKWSFYLNSFWKNMLQMFLFILLLFILWSMSKFTFLSVGSIRGFV